MKRNPFYTRRASSKAVRDFIAGGPEPKVDPYAMAHRDLDGPDESATHRLAAAIHWAESDCVAISWSAQLRAAAFYNDYGLARALDECVRLEALRLRADPE